MVCELKPQESKLLPYHILFPLYCPLSPYTAASRHDLLFICGRIYVLDYILVTYMQVLL